MKLAAFPISSSNRFLNSVADALENVSIRSCSCFTSSVKSNDASLCTSTLVLPLPGPAATTTCWLVESLIISNWAGDNAPNNCWNLAGVSVRLISSCLLPGKYLLKKKIELLIGINWLTNTQRICYYYFLISILSRNMKYDWNSIKFFPFEEFQEKSGET